MKITNLINSKQHRNETVPVHYGNKNYTPNVFWKHKSSSSLEKNNNSFCFKDAFQSYYGLFQVSWLVQN